MTNEIIMGIEPQMLCGEYGIISETCKILQDLQFVLKPLTNVIMEYLIDKDELKEIIKKTTFFLELFSWM